MIDSKTAITNLERDLREQGWRPVEMVDEHTSAPFTRWFPPARDAPFGVGPNEPTDPETAQEQR